MKDKLINSLSKSQLKDVVGKYNSDKDLNKTSLIKLKEMVSKYSYKEITKALQENKK